MKVLFAAVAGFALLGVGAWAEETAAPAASATPVATTTTAAAPTSPAVSTVPAEKPKKEKKICKEDPNTGSFITSRTCHTKAEWDEIEKSREGAADVFMDNVNNRVGVGIP